ncbi:unnamed protein product [Gulo gulo]|uniref:Uncharacterized protein n=1 Tax=Gulo gulo TaxID=48420 RepID=A0A9X9LVV4_GULGU|nr:unnamed protein product [Gulo gulo]
MDENRPASRTTAGKLFIGKHAICVCLAFELASPNRAAFPTDSLVPARTQERSISGVVHVTHPIGGKLFVKDSTS